MQTDYLHIVRIETRANYRLDLSHVNNKGSFFEGRKFRQLCRRLETLGISSNWHKLLRAPKSASVLYPQKPNCMIIRQTAVVNKPEKMGKNDC